VIAGMRESIGHSVGRFDFAGALLAGAGGSCLDVGVCRSG
jgi:hypothetical protein